MSSHNDSFAASGSSPTPDFLCENHGSVFLLRPISPAAFLWIHENLPSDRQMFGNAVAVEHRCLGNPGRHSKSGNGRVPMKTSPSGAVIMSGAGVAAVRQKIELAFRKADIPTDISAGIDLKLEMKAAEKSRPPLAELAAPILKVAERRAHTPVRNSHLPKVYKISCPEETAEELFRLALREVE